ncbi:peptidase M3 [Aeromonas schubertii]|uniref:M3 family oligoendopeptidase n=1 Tax=Aeromonas schubertii TaxID=652 RepID=UPI00067F4E02|nr:M3 family oligoendopeptidase [Aeromonas schubertii]KUE79137.1 peptidase M3 [Aeromonas schubertii]
MTYQTIWRDEHIFTAPDAPEVARTLAHCREGIATLAEAAKGLVAGDEAMLAERLVALREQGDSLHHAIANLGTYAYNRLSRNGKESASRELLSRAMQLDAELAMAEKPVELFWARADQALVDKLLAHPALHTLAYRVSHQRLLSDQLLSLESEQLVEGLGVDGLQAWGNLYDTLVAKLQVQVGDETTGLAQAANLLSHPERARRYDAWHGIYQAWGSEQETVAAILNAINGWRIELARQRGTARQLDALEISCHQSHIERETLDTLMAQAFEHKELGRRALRAMARVHGVSDFGPWDLYAPAPAEQSRHYGFDEAIELVAEAFGGFDPEMGAFAHMMAEKGWIDADPTEGRRTGAYCTEYADPAEPRVFITFEGTMDNVITLAHELGHAWHSWLLRDQCRELRNYPMTLAETASIFAETLVREALMGQAQSREERRAIAWMEADSAAAMLVDIPSRYDFECRLVAARHQGHVGAERLRELMQGAMECWYGDTLCRHNDLFWASKGHFSIAELGFYNYPYLFGYLFSLGVYAQRARLGSDFAARYRALLEDTGAMSAEALVQKHLGADIGHPDFWRASLSLVAGQIERFESLL